MSVQVEHGHVKIATELFHFLCSFRIPGECRLVFDAIVRKTWGWKKKEDRIPVSQIAELTKLKKQNVSRSLAQLIEHKLVIKNDDKLRINKNYSEWISFFVNRNQKRLQPKLSSKTITPVIENDDKSSSKTMDSIANKATYQKQGDLLASNEAVVFSYFGELKETSEKIVSLASEFDIRPKDVVFMVRKMLASETEKEKAIKNVRLKLLTYINNGLRWHTLSTLSDKNAETSKPPKVADESWIERIKIMEGI